MDEDAYHCEKELWRCRKHPFQSCHGVCPGCLRDRLLLLCPDCANLRPCACLPSSSSSSSASSSSSSLSLLFDPPRSSVSSAIGAIGRVGNLIDGEPAFRRSRSAAFELFLPRFDYTGQVFGVRRERRQRWAMFRSFSKSAAKTEEEAADPQVGCVDRERSSAGSVDRSGGEGWGKAWGWRFPRLMNRFRHRRASRMH